MFYRAKLLVCFHSLIFFSINIIYSIYSYQTSEDKIGNDTINQEISIRFYTYLLFIVIIMIINMWEILKYWIDSRKKEFYMYRVVGADRNQVLKMFTIDYCKVIAASIILGSIACWLFSLLPLEYSKSVLKSFDGILGILIISYAVPMMAGIIMLWRQQNIDGFK